ncbi:PREDICTED: uncharacterized protein LOC101305392 [Fragaria vesca subsp. vesca]
MEFFKKAKAVRFRSHHDKYLLAGDDGESIWQDRDGYVRNARWVVEMNESGTAIRLKSCYGKYLTASNMPGLLGMKSKKVVQTLPKTLDSTVEWEPIREEGFKVKLKMAGSHDEFLRANGGVPPWRNSITHDTAHRKLAKEWVLWDLDVVEIVRAKKTMPDGGDLEQWESCSSSSENDDMISLPTKQNSDSKNSESPSDMEVFKKAKVVRFRSHHDKYLIADEDGETVTQDRDGTSTNARWTVEFVNHAETVRFKSCYGKYLTASNQPFRPGRGYKVLQTQPRLRLDSSMEWEPVREGLQVRLVTPYGQFLCANGGVPPWRNSITHDAPGKIVRQDWILWDVDVLKKRSDDFTTTDDDDEESSQLDEPKSQREDIIMPIGSKRDRFREEVRANVIRFSDKMKKVGLKHHAMEFFKKARVIRLRSHHDKYLIAEDDQESVCQDRDGTVRNARWTVEITKNGTLRFKSVYEKYLTASNMPFRLGLRGKKVLQTLPKRLDSSLEWEPVREGYQIKLKTPYGQFLRANGGVPPWRNSITHDVPHRSARQDWILWDIDVVELKRDSPEHPSMAAAEPAPPARAQSPPAKAQSPHAELARARAQSPPSKAQSAHAKAQSPRAAPQSPPAVEEPPPPPPELPDEEIPESSTSTKIELRSLQLGQEESGKSFDHGSPMKKDGRMIFYHVADDIGEAPDDGTQDVSFLFKGSGVEDLKKMLKEETGLEDFQVCSRNPLNGQLYPLRLHLPPNNHDMHVVVVPSLT